MIGGAAQADIAILVINYILFNGLIIKLFS
jgi:hypothetical protein